jgi:DNA-binding transcriptional MocR family regulator
MFVWARLPGGLDGADLARRALEENMVLAPGNVFSPQGCWGDFMRFNVAMMDDAVYAVLARLLDRAA